MLFYEYCKINKWKVNLRKTKMILFQKNGHGHMKKYTSFFYGEEIIEYVKEYEYLGVKITKTALYENAKRNSY